jgi:hypothetical protein
VAGRPLQNLYGRPEPPARLGDPAFRHQLPQPADILATLRLLLPLAEPVMAGSPDGAEVDILTYANPDELVTRSVSAITRAIGLGFKRSHIALISYRGRAFGPQPLHPDRAVQPPCPHWPL